MRRASRVDANHASIVQALRRVGCSVCDASRLGSGAPDLLVGFRGTNYFLEVKSARGQQNAVQEVFEAGWRGHYAVVRSVDHALAVVGVLKPSRVQHGITCEKVTHRRGSGRAGWATRGGGRSVTR